MNKVKKITACAALVTLCGSLCANAVWAVYSRDLGPSDFGTGIYDKVDVCSEAGGLVLSRSVSAAPYLWVPSPIGGTVSKIDARSGRELARYWIGPRGGNWQPCAVAVDNDGNAYIACKCPASTGKIVKITGWDVSDVNGDRKIVTSVDRNGDGRVSATEIVGWGKDEAVSVLTPVGGINGCPSTLIFDQRGYLWVALSEECNLAKVDVTSGAVVGTYMTDGHPDYLLNGTRNCLWVLSREDGTLCQINTITGRIDGVTNFGRCDTNAMCFDGKGMIWISSAEGLISFDPDKGQWFVCPTKDHAAMAGIAYDGDGGLWSAYPAMNDVIKFSADAGEELIRTHVGDNPCSVSADVDNNIWVLNSSSSSAMRVNPRSAKVISDVATIGMPFSASPFTTYDMVTGVCPMGNWRMIIDSSIPEAAWGSLNWISGGQGNLRFEVRSAEFPELLPTQPFLPVCNGQQFSVPGGRYLEVRASFRGDGYTSPVLKELHVEGVNRPPDISAVKPTKTVLLNHDGKFEWIGISGVKDPEGDKVSVVVTGISQDEPVCGGENDKAADATGVGTNGAWLRRICNMGTPEAPGNGRVYTVTYKATDEYGASATGRVRVSVPAAEYPAVGKDDGAKFDSTKFPKQDLVAKS